MSAPVPIFGWASGAELASLPGEDMDREALYGLVWNDKSGAWEHPRLAALKNKKISVADLDDEELRRGQLRDSDGKFRGGPLRKIPAEFHDELMRRIMDVGVEKIRDSYLASLDLLVDIVSGNAKETIIDKEGNEHEVPVNMTLRSQTAKYLVERLAGKTPDRVEVAVAVKPWEKTMEAIITEIPAGDPDIIYAEEVE